MTARVRWQGIGIWLGCAVALTWVMYVLGHRQYGAFDDNIVVDTAWRMFSGQRPYADFMIPLSPEFYLGAGWAFRLFGVSWSALVWMSIVMALVTFALQSAALAQVTPPAYAIGVSLACQMLAMVVTSYWWYNSNASITACVMFSIAYALVRRPESTLLVVLYGLAVAMIALMKVNIAALSIAATALTLLTIKPLRYRIIASACLGGIAALAVLWLSHLNPLDILHAYAGMAGKRGRPTVANLLTSKPNESFMVLPLIAGFAMCAGRGLFMAIRSPQMPARRELVPQALLMTAGLVLAALLMCWSTEELTISGLPLVVLSVANFLNWAHGAGVVAGRAGRTLTAAVALCALAAIVGFVIFDRLRDDAFIGPAGFSAANRIYLMQWALLVVSAAGLAVTAGARALVGRQFERLVAAARAHVRATALAGIAFAIAAATYVFWSDVPLIASYADAGTRRGHVLYLGALVTWSGAVSIVFVAAVLTGRRNLAVRWSVLVALLVATSAIAGGLTAARRLRVRINGPGLFYSEYLLSKDHHPLFAGMTTYRTLQMTVDDIGSALAEYRRAGYDTSRVFFGIRLEFAYAAFGIPSPMHLPVWWDPAASYPLRDEPLINANFIGQGFPICVFFGDPPDFTYLPDPVVSYLTNNYTFHPRRYITVLTRNPQTVARSRN